MNRQIEKKNLFFFFLFIHPLIDFTSLETVGGVVLSHYLFEFFSHLLLGVRWGGVSNCYLHYLSLCDRFLPSVM